VGAGTSLVTLRNEYLTTSTKNDIPRARLREHNIKQLIQEKQPSQAAFFVLAPGNVDRPTRHTGACSAPFSHNS
jgi:hypothetical protein